MISNVDEQYLDFSGPGTAFENLMKVMTSPQNLVTRTLTQNTTCNC